MAERVFSLARLCVAAAIAALLVCAGALAYIARDLPSNPVDARLFAAGDLKFVMGSGRADGERLLIDGFTDQYALLSSGPVAVNADDYRFLQVSLGRLPEGEAPSLFWRRSEAPADLVQLRLGESGDSLIELSRHPNWRGEISELGFLFHDDGGPPVTLGPATLEPDTFALRLRLTWDSWTAFEHWTQKSINFLQGGAFEQPVRLPLLVMAWIVLTLALVTLLARLSGQRGARELMASGALIFIVAWMALDLRWTTNNSMQFRETTETYRGMEEADKLRRGLDGEIYQYIERLQKEVLPEQPARILIIGDDQAVEYFLQRAKYHLLPHSAYAARKLPETLSPDSMDYLVFFAPNERLADNIPEFQADWVDMLSIVDRDSLGTVFEIDTPAVDN